jgi:DNA invertase Pin-like site-specific DNA recombinase
MTRVALYARYSSDNQRDASIQDQLRLCREHARKQGWTVTDTYSDRSVSGASLIRAGIQELLQDARQGGFDVVLAEALDRISRDQEDVAAVFKRLCFAGVKIVTLAEGDICELHVGLKGTMNALFLKDLAAKTHRGIRGRIEAGKNGGGNCYGYRVVKMFDAAGEPIRGEREIIEAEAAVIRRIFREFAAGRSPRRIAIDLNRAGIPGPEGGRWVESSLRGNRRLGNGILNNELYIGRIVWNRQRCIKDPQTGRRVLRQNPVSEWVRAGVPDLRIVDDALWRSVKERQGDLAVTYAKAITASRKAIAQALNATHRPRTLLSGLLVCGCCGGSFVRRGQDRYACRAYLMAAGCDNSRTIDRKALEHRVLHGLKSRLMAPEVAAEAIRAYAEETNRLNHERRTSGDTDRKTLAAIERKIKEIVTAIEDGGYTRGLSDRLRELEVRQDEITQRLSAAPAEIPDIHPNIADIYRRKVARLAEALNHPEDRHEATAALRGLIERIVLTPRPKRGQLHATLHGGLETVLEWVARTGDAGPKNKARAFATRLSLSAHARA